MAIPQNTSAAQLASVAEYYNPESGLSKVKRLSDGNVFEVHAVDYKGVDGWQFVHRDTPSVTERLEAMSHADLVQLREQNGTITGSRTAHHADLVREIVELVKREVIAMPAE